MNATKVLIWLATAPAVAIAMDFWAAFLHGRVWHGLLWRFHRSHHTPRVGRFELNDVLSATHMPIAVGLVLFGCLGTPGLGRELAFGVGLGMSVFGIAYLVVHDGLVHGRLPVQGLLRFASLRRVVGAHRGHHHTGRAPYGLFSGPWELARRRTRRESRHPLL